MALDISGLFETLPAIFGALPMFFQAMELVGYLFLIMFFGSIAIKGIRGQTSFFIRFFLRIGFGFLCVIAAAVLAPLLPFDQGIFQLFQINLTVAGVLSAAVFAAGLFMLTLKAKPAIHDITSKMHKFERQLERIEGALKKRKILKMLSDKEAMSQAQKHIKQGFRAIGAELKEDIWKVRLLNKSGSKAVAYVDAYSGEIKEVATGLKVRIDPLKLAGIALIAILTLYTLVNFTGLPSFTQNFFSFIGISEEDFGRLTQAIGSGTPEGCPNAVGVLQKFNEDLANNQATEYNSAQLRKLVEDRGYTVDRMYMVSYSGGQYVVALTTDLSFCITTQTAFCQCINSQNLLG